MQRYLYATEFIKYIKEHNIKETRKLIDNFDKKIKFDELIIGMETDNIKTVCYGDSDSSMTYKKEK